MAFIQTDVNYATQYARELATAYPYLNYFGAIYGGENSTRFRPTGGKVVAVPSLTVSGSRAVNRDQINGVFNRNWNNEWQYMALSMDREWDTLIDPMDIVETNDVATIANVTRVYNEQQKAPEMDAYCASKLATFAVGAGAFDATSLTAANVLTQWDMYLQYMTERRVNRDRLTAYVTPATYTALKQSAGITRFMEVGRGIQGVDRNIARLDGVYIMEVPSDMMRQAYDFSDGWAVLPGAGQINMLLVDPSATIAPVVYETSMISAPTAQTKGKYVYYERHYYDVFAMNIRAGGFFANLTAVNTLGRLMVISEAGTESGTSVINVTGGNGYNTSKLYYIAGATVTAPTAGTAISTATYSMLPVGQNIALTNGQTIQVVEVNGDTLMPLSYGTATIVSAS